MRIMVDSREQKPIEFDVSGAISSVTTTGLPFADYWCEWEPGSEKAGYSCEMPVVFERKSIGDLFGTLGKGMERFKREIERAKENNVQMILIVEGSIRDVARGYEHSKREGDSILKTMFTLWVKYDLVPVFCNDRHEMRRFMIETWEACGRNFKPKKICEGTNEESNQGKQPDQ